MIKWKFKTEHVKFTFDLANKDDKKSAQQDGTSSSIHIQRFKLGKSLEE